MIIVEVIAPGRYLHFSMFLFKVTHTKLSSASHRLNKILKTFLVFKSSSSMT